MYKYFFILTFLLISCTSTPEFKSDDENKINHTIYTTQAEAQKAQEEYKKLQIKHK